MGCDIGEIGNTIGVTNIDECEIRCRGTKGCVWFMYDAGAGSCALRKYGCEMVAPALPTTND